MLFLGEDEFRLARFAAWGDFFDMQNDVIDKVEALILESMTSVHSILSVANQE